MRMAKTDESRTMLSRWFLCVAIAMAAQMLLLLVWSFLGPGNGLDRIMDPVYADTAHCIAERCSSRSGCLWATPRSDWGCCS